MIRNLSFITFLILANPVFARQADCSRALVEAAPSLTINTSNPGKQEEFARLFAAYGKVQFSVQDLHEVDSDALTVAVQKASQFHGQKPVIVEDSALFVEGADIGVNVRWLIDSLPSLAGRRAVWTVHLAYRQGNLVYVYKGEIRGKIVAKRQGGGSFPSGFDPFFLPDGTTKTLSEAKPDQYNARAMAVTKMIRQKDAIIRPAIDQWTGRWQ